MWPNPNEGLFFVDFYSPGGDTKVSIVDLTGKIIKVFFDQKVERGRKKMQFDITGVSSGYYRVTVKASDGVKSVPMIIK